MTVCHAHRDGECWWDSCPQLRDGEPKATGRHCPIDTDHPVTAREAETSVETDAVISADERYRYSLTRRWGHGPEAVFIMLNPSTADATRDDPTIRRCVGFAKREGCGSLTVVNLFALRATNPRDLLNAADPVGPDNSRHITRALLRADLRIAAWGSFQWANRHRLRRPYVEDWAGGEPLLCLGMTKEGLPRHPLYVRADQPLVEWST